MPEQKPQKRPTGYSGIAPTDYPSRSLRTQQDWKLEQQFEHPITCLLFLLSRGNSPAEEKSPGEPGPVSLGDST